MTIQNGLFRQNGQFHFTLNDKIQYVQDNISYSFNAASDSNSPSDKTDTSSKKTISNTKKIIRYSCLGVGVVGIVTGTIFAIQASNTLKDINSAKAAIEAGNYKGTQDDYNALGDNLNSQNILTGVFFGLGAVGLIGFTATFVF
jgi:hypothetical protein